MAKSKALSSLGRFFGGGAKSTARNIGNLAGRGISTLTGGGGGSLPTIRQGVVNPQRPGSQTAAQSTFGSGPGRPSSLRSSGYGTGGFGGGGGTATGSWQDVFAGMQSRKDTLREQQRLGQANEANVAAYNKAFASANEANEARYQQLLGITGETTGQRAKDITADFTGQQASAMQNLANLGLANTSGASTIRGGFGRKKNEALDRLADQMQQTKLGIIERRQDLPPSLASLVSLGQLGISGLNFG